MVIVEVSLRTEVNIIIGQLKTLGKKGRDQTPIYKCQGAWQGIPHSEARQFRAKEIEPIVFEAIAAYIGKLQENENVFDEIFFFQNKEKAAMAKELRKRTRDSRENQKKNNSYGGKDSGCHV